MRIGCDLTFTARSQMGTGVYAENTALALADALSPDDALVGFSEAGIWEGELARRLLHVKVPTPVDGVSVALCRRVLWDSAIADTALDVYFAPTGMAPVVKTCPVVITVHDLLFEHEPSYYSPDLLALLKSEIPRSVRAADHVIAISRHTKEDLILTYGCADEKITVVHQGIRKSFLLRPEPKAIRRAKTALDLRQPYFLTLSNHSPHKNTAYLLEVFDEWIKASGDCVHQLVIAGGGPAPAKPIELRKLIADRRLHERVRILGPVADAHLPALMAGAVLFLYPSKHEGWGLPPLEAIMMGTPVIASDCGALPEAVGEAGIILPLEQPKKWVEALEQLVRGAPSQLRSAMQARRTVLANTTGVELLDTLRSASSRKTAKAPPTCSSLPAQAAGVSGCTIVRNAISLGYPLRESIASYAPLCSEIILSWDPTSEDATAQLVRQIAVEFPQVRLVESVWNMKNQADGTELARQTQIAFGHCAQTWTLYVQADEALHENAYPLLREHVADESNNAVAFRRRSFLLSLDTEILDHRVEGLVRLFRTGQGRSVGAAMQCAINGNAGRTVQTTLELFNYSRLGTQEEIDRRCRNLDRFYHDDTWARPSLSSSSVRFRTDPFTGAHPRPIEQRFRNLSAPTGASSVSGTATCTDVVKGGPERRPPVRVSVQIIASERDEFGALLFGSCLESLQGYADQIVIVDNGLGEQVRELIKRKSSGLPMQLMDGKGVQDFAELRNRALRATRPTTTHIHVVDTDEVYFPAGLSALKEVLGDGAVVAGKFVHFMIEPGWVESVQPKARVFRWHPQLRWEGSVHERLLNFDQTQALENQFSYLHFGYCRPQWQTFLKWLRYARLQGCDITHYQYEIVDGVRLPWFREGRTPDTVLESRRRFLQQYAGTYPNAVEPWMEEYARSTGHWRAWVASKVDNALWDKWRGLYESRGNWEETLVDILHASDVCQE